MKGLFWAWFGQAFSHLVAVAAHGPGYGDDGSVVAAVVPAFGG